MGILGQFFGGGSAYPSGGGFMDWLQNPATLGLAAGLMSEPDDLGAGLAAGAGYAGQVSGAQERRDWQQQQRQKRQQREAMRVTPMVDPNTGRLTYLDTAQWRW